VKSKTLFICLLSLSFMMFYYGVSPVYAGGITVTTVADTDAVDGDCSLREAIIAANTNVAYNDCTISGLPGDDTIDLTTLIGTLPLVGHLPLISETVQFNGPSTNNLTIDGLTTFNAFESTPAAVNIGVDRLIVTNVISDGIYATDNITVTNSTIVSSECGVFSQNGSAFVSSSQITGQNCVGWMSRIRLS
jgi:CSLREA domain-containing protein